MSFTFQLCLKFLTCSQVRDRTLVLYLPAVQRALNAARRCHVVVVFSGQRRSFQLLYLSADAVGSFGGGGTALITLFGLQPSFK